MNVLVATMFSPAYESVADITLPVLRNYCLEHGYELTVIPCPDWKFHYVKHEWLKEKMQEDIDVFFYIDADAIITNPEISIESLIDEDHSLFISEDATELNGGVFILKNNDWANFFNNTVLEERDNFNNEQNIYVHYKDHPNFRPHIKILPQYKINSYDHSLYPELADRIGGEDLGDWKLGHFIFHVPALTIPNKIQELKKHIQ